MGCCWKSVGLVCALALSACQTPVHQSADERASASGEAFRGWQAMTLPGKVSTHYAVRRDGTGPWFLRAHADASASMWRKPIAFDAGAVSHVRFGWRVPALMPDADLARADAADAVVRVVFAFDGDHARLPWRDRMLMDMAEGLTGERPPYATLMYVWDTRAALETVLPGGRSNRLRKLVVETGPARLGPVWQRYERDLQADFAKAFGEPAGRLIGVAVMTDGDNTGSRAQADYLPIELLNGQGASLVY